MLQLEDSYLLIATAMILSLLFALFIYYKDRRFNDASRITKAALVVLRFISLATIVLFLFNPKWVNTIKQVEKPIIVVLQDASSSVLNNDDSLFYKTKFIELVKKNNQALAADFEVYTFHFNDSLHEGLNSDYNGKETDISDALQKIEAQFNNRNLSAIILASDGLYNKGIHPSYSLDILNTPIFTLALGDSTVQKDIALQNIRFNEIAYLGNEFPIELEVYSNFGTREKKHLQITNQGKIIYEEWFSIEENTPLKKQILLEATKEGIQYYQIKISSFDGEKNTQNNQFTVALEVVNNSQDILILAAAPHPDIAALKSALELGENYKVNTSLFHEFKEDISSYNLIILHQIPGHGNRNSELLKKIKNSNTSLLYITGNRTNWNKFNQSQDLLFLKTNNTIQEVFPILNEKFSPFDLDENAVSFIQSAPPLQAPTGEITKNNFSHSLFKQNIEGIETSKELFVFSEKEEQLVGILLAEGLWKWRLYDYQKNKSHDNFNELIQSISQYLTLNTDKRKLRIHYPKLSTEGAIFKINAQLYNDNYQLIENAELNLNLVDKLGNEYKYTLTNKGTNYSTSIENLSRGNYDFTLSSSYKEEQLVQKGGFAMLAASLEQQTLEANWHLLKKISSLSNGLFIEKEKIANYSEILKENVSAKPSIYFSKQLSDLIKQKAIFLVLLLSLFFEWVLRKRLGTH